MSNTLDAHAVAVEPDFDDARNNPWRRVADLRWEYHERWMESTPKKTTF